MAFVRKLVGPDEKLIGIAYLHWIYGVKGLMWLGGFVLLGGLFNHLIVKYLGYSATVNPAFTGIVTLGTAVFWICLAIGACLFLFYFVMLIATEVGLTSKRLVYKKGLVFVDVKEIDLEEIKAANVDNGVLGRILNYGTIHLDARFVGDIDLPSVADPYRFVKALNETRTYLKENLVHIVMEENKDQKRAEIALKQALGQSENNEPPSDDHAAEGNQNDLDDPRYKAMDDVEPMAMINDIAAEIREDSRAVQKSVPGKAARPAKNGYRGPTLFKRQNKLREAVLDEFSQSTTDGATTH